MAEVVLDANVLVGFLDKGDSLHGRALDLLDRLEKDGHDFVLLDICVEEAISVLCRRTEERSGRKAAGRQTSDPPDLGAIIDEAERWAQDGEIRWVAREAERLHTDVFDLIRSSNGVLNFNDALMVVLARAAIIANLASFDKDFDQVEGVRRIE
jgi:predicted nucleic acid-binding protein